MRGARVSTIGARVRSADAPASTPHSKQNQKQVRFLLPCKATVQNVEPGLASAPRLNLPSSAGGVIYLNPTPAPSCHPELRCLPPPNFNGNSSLSEIAPAVTMPSLAPWAHKVHEFVCILPFCALTVPSCLGECSAEPGTSASILPPAVEQWHRSWPQHHRVSAAGGQALLTASHLWSPFA